ncbi:MAG: hypothetical protein JO007_18645 [Alphaproteobacteria bacterium]|nr:hypothetical protein [Alphaproteobacteria bacterium]
MAYLTYRVEITRDELSASTTPNVEITAYIDRVPETDAPEFGRLSRAYKGVWNSRLQYTGDFEALSEAVKAIEAAYPAIEQIRCYEWSIDYEFPNEMAPLRKLGDKWLPGKPFFESPPPQLAWLID